MRESTLKHSDKIKSSIRYWCVLFIQDWLLSTIFLSEALSSWASFHFQACSELPYLKNPSQKIHEPLMFSPSHHSRSRNSQKYFAHTVFTCYLQFPYVFPLLPSFLHFLILIRVASLSSPLRKCILPWYNRLLSIKPFSKFHPLSFSGKL